MTQTSFAVASDAAKEAAEEQIKQLARVVDYNIKEYPVEVFVGLYQEGEAEGRNEIFIPDYQRDFVWGPEKQSRFIESLLLGLPIPYLFVADVSSEDEELSGRLEIVDGTQRTRTLHAFLNDALRLTDLAKLTTLNGFIFSELLPSRQRRFKRTTIRLIELTEKADEETRRDMFDRINSGGEKLKPMEVRRGVRPGEFLKMIESLAADTRLREMAPLSDASVKRRDYEELVIRFFAYRSKYDRFDRSVIDFINEYIDETESRFDAKAEAEFRRLWNEMLDFVASSFDKGFKKAHGHSRTPRVRFEAIAVGASLAIEARPKLRDEQVDTSWVESPEFKRLVTSDGANSRPRITKRIEYVRDRLLGNATPVS